MPLYLEKPIGKTPLDIIKDIKGKEDIKYSFAGRLDPMARGKLIILKGDECKIQHLYCNFDKIYEFEILFGIKTDTYDILGIIQSFININYKEINFNINKYTGEFEQPYPPYSSIIVNKKPLWLWSKEGKIEEISIPTKKINIYNLEFLKDINILNEKELLSLIKKKIYKLDKSKHTDFRVEQIIKLWETYLTNNKFKPIIKKFRVKVSSGTYIRSLVNRIGEDLGVGAIAFDIHRTEFLNK
tara:strand:- start:557 stop:1282 length:726 start_codon:yes stop_codon:yes gene_type:complete